VIYVLVDDYIDFVLVMMFVYFDVIIEFLCDIVLLGIYFVVDLLILILCIFDLCYIFEEYYNIVVCVK